MSRFKPFVTINLKNFKAKRVYFDTYKQLLSAIENLISESSDGEAHVIRSRRGEWGEWFEIWERGKKKVIEGWM